MTKEGTNLHKVFIKLFQLPATADSQCLFATAGGLSRRDMLLQDLMSWFPVKVTNIR